jgi:hypothetical protein
MLIYPYSKDIKQFKAQDIQWDIINRSVEINEFNPARFAFEKKWYLSPELLALDQKFITIKGFIKNEKHGTHTVIIITESVTNVCFMCKHDEMYKFIEIIPDKNDNQFQKIKDDTYVQVEGIFKIKPDHEHSIFTLEKANLLKYL